MKQKKHRQIVLKMLKRKGQTGLVLRLMAMCLLVLGYSQVVFAQHGPLRAKAAAELKFDLPDDYPTSTGYVLPPYYSDFDEPTLDYDTDGDISYSSSGATYVEVDDTDGEITTKKAGGTATIKASSKQTDDYKAGTATYKIKVQAITFDTNAEDGTWFYVDGTKKNSGAVVQTLTTTQTDAFVQPELKVKFANLDKFYPQLSENDVEYTLKYKSNNENIAIVDEDSGELEFKGGTGTVTITCDIESANEAGAQFTKKTLTYKVTVNQAPLTAAFYQEDVKAPNYVVLPNAEAFELPELVVKSGEDDVDGYQVTYKSSNAAVSVGEDDGAIIINGLTGTATQAVATITATVTATGYKTATATYKITVKKIPATAGFYQDGSVVTAKTVKATEIDDFEAPEAMINFTTTGFNPEIDADDIKREIVFASDKEDVAEVGDDGRITFGEKTGSANIKVTYSSENAQFATKTASYRLTVTKAPLNASFENTSFNTNPGMDFTAPSLAVVSDGDDISDYEVEYTSSDVEVASVDSDGEVTIGSKKGEATITAKVDAGWKYATAQASYKITVEQEPLQAEFQSKAFVVLPGMDDFEQPELLVNSEEEEVDPEEVSYTSSDAEIASVDESDGSVVIGKKEGTATITAVVNAGVKYSSAVATYTITVKKPAVSSGFERSYINLKGAEVEKFEGQEVSLTVVTSGYSPEVSSSDIEYVIDYKSSNGDVASVDQYTGEITMGTQTGTAVITATVSPEVDGLFDVAVATYTVQVDIAPLEASFLNTALTVAPDEEVDNTLTVVADGEEITDYGVTYSSSNPDVATVDDNGLVTLEKRVGTAVITAKVSNGPLYETVEAGYTITVEKSLVMNTQEDNTFDLNSWDGYALDVTVEGLVMNAENWYTICLPFDVDANMTEEVFGSDVDIEMLDASDFDEKEKLLTLTFAKKIKMEAGRPYMMKVVSPVSNPVFHAVKIDGGQPVVVNTTYCSMQGCYEPTGFTADDKSVLFVQNNQFYYPTTTDPLPATKCWFSLFGAAQQARGMSLEFVERPDDLDGIDEIGMDDNGEVDHNWYTIDGLQIDQPRKGGIYIHNRRKVVWGK